MQFRRFIFLALALALGACGAHEARMEAISPVADSMSPQFKGAILVGEVSGGSSALNSTGVTNGEFKDVLQHVLGDNGLLAPGAAEAHYRLDVVLDFAPGENPTFEASRTEATITYRLFKPPQDSPVLERTIKTAYQQAAPGAGTEAAIFLLGGIGGLIGEARTREELTYEGSVRNNIRYFLDALAGLGAPAQPTSVAAETPEPPAQPQPSPPPANSAAALNATMAALAATAPKPAPQTAAPSPATPAQVATLPPPAAPATPPKRFGEEVAFDCPAAGTEIDFRSGLTRVFAPKAADEPDCAYKGAHGLAETTAFGPYRSAAAEVLRGLWPLRIGNSVSFSSTSAAAQRYAETYRVVRHEFVTVPAGTFDTFVITWEGTGQDQYTNGYHETATFWYAPELGYVVKVEHHLEGGMYARVADDEAVRVIRR
jgi:hypothetical protein